MTFKLSDLPADAVERLKPLSFHDFDRLAIDANRMRDEEALAELPSDPAEAAKGANACLIRSDTMINVDDAEGFVESVLEVACRALSNPDFDNIDAQHLGRVLRAACYAQQASMKNTSEANQRLRAVFHK